jgi:hypothetical protein
LIWITPLSVIDISFLNLTPTQVDSGHATNDSALYDRERVCGTAIRD